VLYPGLMLIVVGCLTRGLVRRTALLSGALLVASAAPLSLVAAAALSGALLLLAASPGRAGERNARAAVLALVSGAAIEDARRQIGERLEMPAGTAVIVVGDSLSAGPASWPATFAARSGCRVDNRAFPGARLAQAAGQLTDRPSSPCVVLVELGGNDLLGGVPSSAFARDLDAALSWVSKTGCRTAMLELPLYPFQDGYGRAQRDAAARHGVVLLPRRILATALTWPGNTSDGLHLSASGHSHLGMMLASWVTCAG
jgi:lysophospholipase L1-like esterase